MILRITDHESTVTLSHIPIMRHLTDSMKKSQSMQRVSIFSVLLVSLSSFSVFPDFGLAAQLKRFLEIVCICI